jgi:dolichol-phosphate mannosyltransferase
MQKTVNFLPSKAQVKEVLVIAAYNEFENLRELLRELDELLPMSTAIIVADDTGADTEVDIEKIVIEILSKERNWLISFEDKKSGRGNAILRSFRIASTTFPELNFYAECDADGSHRPIDIIKILLAPQSDFLIGSRYLPESRIQGWPLSRKIVSKILNKLIPVALGIRCTDVTNGLRRYSKIAAEIIMQYPQEHTGFIFLSEQALLLTRNGINPKEEPIIFINRIYGESSVGMQEVINSLKGVFSLYLASKHNQK